MMKLKTLAVPATLAATTAFAGAANATATIDVNVDYFATTGTGTNITIGTNPTPQYSFWQDPFGKAYLTGQSGATVAAPGPATTYEKQVETSSLGNGDYGLRFAINGVDYAGLATIDQGGHHISRIQASPLAAAVPEPATWATMILGLGVAGAAVRRRRQSAAAAAA